MHIAMLFTPKSSASVELWVFIFCFLQKSMMEPLHHTAGVTFEVRVDCKGCIFPPVNEAHGSGFQGQAQAQVVFQVVEELTLFSPVTLVRIIDPRGEKSKGCLRISSWSSD